MDEYRIHFSCPRSGYIDIVAKDELEASEKAEDILHSNDIEEEMIMVDIFGEWLVTQIERL